MRIFLKFEFEEIAKNCLLELYSSLATEDNKSKKTYRLKY